MRFPCYWPQSLAWRGTPTPWVLLTAWCSLSGASCSKLKVHAIRFGLSHGVAWHGMAWRQHMPSIECGWASIYSVLRSDPATDWTDRYWPPSAISAGFLIGYVDIISSIDDAHVTKISPNTKRKFSQSPPRGNAGWAHPLRASRYTIWECRAMLGSHTGHDEDLDMGIGDTDMYGVGNQDIGRVKGRGPR